MLVLGLPQASGFLFQFPQATFQLEYFILVDGRVRSNIIDMIDGVIHFAIQLI